MNARKRQVKLTWRELWPVWLIFGVLFAGGLIGLRLVSPKAGGATLLQAGQDIMQNESQLEVGMPKLFSYPVGPAQRAELFVERGPDGAVAVAFASCRKCYRSGHYQQDGQIICGHCNQRMERLSSGQTPAVAKDCKQLRIPFEQSGDQLIIRARSVRDTFARWYAPIISYGPETGSAWICDSSHRTLGRDNGL